MINYKNLRLYTVTTNNLAFDNLKTNPIELIFIGENCTFKDVYNFLNIKLIYVRNLLIPRYKSQNIKLLNKEQDALELKKELGIRFVTTNPKRIALKNENFFFDFSPILDLIIQKYPNLKSSIPYFKFQEAFNTLNEPFKSKKYKKIILYTIDLDKPFNIRFFDRKFFLLFRMLLLHSKGKMDLPFDDILLCTIDDGIPTYRKLMENKEYNLTRIFTIIKSIKPKFINDIELDRASTSILQKTEDIHEEIKDIVDKDEIKYFIHIAKENGLINKDINKLTQLNKKDALLYVIGSTVYSLTGNIEKSKEVVNKLKNKDETQLKQIFSNVYLKIAKELKIPDNPEELVIHTKNEIIDNINIKEIVDNKIPTKLVNKRQVDFSETFINDIHNTFKILENKDVPLIVKSFKKVKPKQKNNDLYPTDLFYIEVELEDPDTKKVFNIRIKLPDFADNNTFQINGIRKILVNQLIPIPIYFPKPHMCRIQTNYATITLEEKTYKKQKVIYSYIGGFDIPLVLICFYYFGLDHTCKMLGVKYKISKETNNLSNVELFTYKEESILFSNVNKDYQKSFMNGLSLLKINNFESSNPITSKDFYSDLIVYITKNKNSLFIIKEILDNIIDDISYEILEAKGLPTKIDDIFCYVIKKLATDYSNNRGDMNVMYMRTSDIISHMVLKQVLKAYNHYKIEKLTTGDANFKFDEDLIFSQLQTSGILQTMEYSNPYEELSYITRYTQAGFGGIHKDAVTLENRALDDTAFGIVSAADTPEGGCLDELTRVITKEGTKFINELNVGDYVLTHKNRYRKVTNIWKKNKELCIINTSIGQIRCSKDHKFLVFNKETGELQFKDVKEIKENKDNYFLVSL